MARRVGTPGVVEGDGYELCCFLTHNATSTEVAMLNSASPNPTPPLTITLTLTLPEVAMWRSTSRKQVVLSFRGTSDLRDALTDVNLLQTPLEEREGGGKSDDVRMVHSGFKASAAAVNRRLKELLVPACKGEPDKWEVLITGHSLGGECLSSAAAFALSPSRSRSPSCWPTHPRHHPRPRQVRSRR